MAAAAPRAGPIPGSDSRSGEEPCFRLETPPVLRKCRPPFLSRDSVPRLRPAMQSAGRCLSDVGLSARDVGGGGVRADGMRFLHQFRAGHPHFCLSSWCIRQHSPEKQNQ